MRRLFLSFLLFIIAQRLWLPREELDNPHKPKLWNFFREGFGVELCFEAVEANNSFVLNSTSDSVVA